MIQRAWVILVIILVIAEVNKGCLLSLILFITSMDKNYRCKQGAECFPFWYLKCFTTFYNGIGQLWYGNRKQRLKTTVLLVSCSIHIH